MGRNKRHIITFGFSYCWVLFECLFDGSMGHQRHYVFDLFVILWVHAYMLSGSVLQLDCCRLLVAFV